MSETVQRIISDLPVGFPKSYNEIREMQMLYTCAMCEICAKMENLSQEFELRKARNPIENIKHRLKSPESIRGKMNRMKGGVQKKWFIS